MAFPRILSRIFENLGAGPLVDPAVLPAPPKVFYPGEIRLWSIPIEVLQLMDPNWQLCNGDLFPQASTVGLALGALDEVVRDLLGITLSSGNYNVPNMFTSDGRGYFIRAVDGTTRTVGDVQGDAIREIAGANKSIVTYDKSKPMTGPYAQELLHNANTAFSGAGNASYSLSYIDFKASRVVPTAAENRPVNIGFEPCIYLDIAA